MSNVFYLLGHAVVVHDRDLRRRTALHQRRVHVHLVRAQGVHALEHLDARMLAAVDLHVLGVGRVARARGNGKLGPLGLDLPRFGFSA